jgi:hypothetical protein
MKIFGTGVQRTGTTSLARALRLLGFTVRDCPVELCDDLEHEVLRRHDAFTDNPIPLLYRELDRRHPGSKFIHTEREERGWLRSVEWLFTVGAVKFRWDRHPAFHRMHRDFYGTTAFEPEAFLAKYRQHNREVREHFAARPGQLLIVDLSRGDGFEKICPFLGVAVPNVPFPHGNQRESMWRVRLRQVVHSLLPRGGARS